LRETICAFHSNSCSKYPHALPTCPYGAFSRVFRGKLRRGKRLVVDTAQYRCNPHLLAYLEQCSPLADDNKLSHIRVGHGMISVGFSLSLSLHIFYAHDCDVGFLFTLPLSRNN
jgi:hypothetical protein